MPVIRTITRDLTATLTYERGDTRRYRVHSIFGTATVPMMANRTNDPELEAVTRYLTDRLPPDTEVTIDTQGGGRYRLDVRYLRLKGDRVDR